MTTIAQDRESKTKKRSEEAKALRGIIIVTVLLVGLFALLLSVGSGCNSSHEYVRAQVHAHGLCIATTPESTNEAL